MDVKKAHRPKMTHIGAGWRETLQIVWTGRKTSKWVLEQIKPEASLEAKMAKPKLSCLGTS